MKTEEHIEALRIADALERPGYGWHSTPAQCAAELRRLHAENETLRAGYTAARLEIESLQRRVQEVGAVARREHERAAAPTTQPAPQQEAQEPSHRETVDVVGVRSNGEHVNLEKIAMPPRMKAREIAIEQFGSFKDDDGSDAEMCFGALEYFLEWLIQQGWSKAPQPAPAGRPNQ